MTTELRTSEASAQAAAMEDEPARTEPEPKTTIEVVTSRDNILKPGINFFSDVAVVAVPIFTKVMTEGGTTLGWSPLVVANDRTMQLLDGRTVTVGGQEFEFLRMPVVSENLARWTYADITNFCGGEQVDPVSIFNRVVDLHCKYLDYRDEGVADTLALWTIGTYFYPMFPAFPYAELNGPRGSGKSKQMNLTAHLAFNGRVVVNPTQGTIFRVIEEERGTVCFDEAEQYGEEKATALMQMFNEGYTAGATVLRCDSRTHELREYEIYSPKMFASIRGIDSTTASRCIQIQCLRSKDKTRGDLDIADGGEDWAGIRHGLYAMALSEFKAVREAFATADVKPFTNRDNQKWAPILALAKVIEARGATGLFARVLEFAKSTIHESAGCSLPPFDEAVVRALYKQTKNAPDFDVSPAQLLAWVRLDTGETWREQTAQLAGYALKSLGFKRARNRIGSSYHVTRDEVIDVAERYDVVLEAQEDTDIAKPAKPATPATSPAIVPVKANNCYKSREFQCAA